MQKIAFLSLLGLALAPLASATVTVGAGPTSLITSPILVKASSLPVGLFSFTLSQDAGESLSMVSVMINNTASSTATTTEFANVSVYKDSGDGNFDSSTDLLSGSQTSVNVGSPTAVTTSANNTVDGGKFFVSLSTSATWSDAAPADSVTVTLPADGIMTSVNSPTVTAATTDKIMADTTGPGLVSAVAQNTGGTSAKEAGDSIDLTFSEATNKPTINAANVNSVFALNNSHSFLDLDGMLGGASWNVAGTVLTITLSASTTASSTIATVAVGDTVTIAGSVVKDLAGNLGAGVRTISGSFSGEGAGTEPLRGTKCSNGLINGQLYKVKDSQTVYLAAACRLKPFRGAAVFHARGMKFQNIIILDSLAGFTVSDHPVLPAEGTLIKGSNATVWFVDSHGMKRGFRSANIFFALGFRFGQVNIISDQDLSTILQGSDIADSSSHPDGSLLICGNSATVFQIVGNERFPFKTADAFLTRGHSFNHIAIANCGIFHYVTGAPVQ